MRYHVGSVRSSLISVALILAAAIACFTVLVSQTAGALDTQVGAVICGDDAPVATIVITQPNDDSIVDQSTMTFRGDVTNTAQIEIQIDGQYHSTLAVGVNQTSFVTDITLTAGTHTITMIVSGICDGATASDSIVVTYQPSVPPSDGGSTPTDVDSGDGVIIGDPDDVNVDEAEDVSVDPFESIPLVNGLSEGIKRFSEAVGLNQTIGQTNPIVASGRVALTVIGITSVSLAGSIAPVIIQMVPGVSNVFHATGVRLRSYVGWAIRGGGVIAFIVASLL
jgi:hypothetical protein